jgi:DNA-binding MarR family transcriptional regulator
MAAARQPTTQAASPGLVAFARLLRAYGTLTRELNAQLVAEHRLTINDYEVLLLLAKAPKRKLRRVDLANDVVLSPSGITRMLDRLEHAGLVAKASCEEDGRVTYAVLTNKGLARVGKIAPAHGATVEKLLAERFDAGELELLGDLLARLAGALPEDVDAAPRASRPDR